MASDSQQKEVSTIADKSYKKLMERATNRKSTAAGTKREREEVNDLYNKKEHENEYKYKKQIYEEKKHNFN